MVDILFKPSKISTMGNSSTYTYNHYSQVELTHALCSTSVYPMHSDYWWMDGQMTETPPATVRLHSPLQEYIQSSLCPYSYGFWW